MTTASFADLFAAAKAEGFTNSALPAGNYDLEVVSATVGSTQGGKPQISVRYKVDGGPSNGATVYDNLALTIDNPKAMAVFFRIIGMFGADEAFLSSLGQVDEQALNRIAGLFAPGTKAKAEVSVRQWNGQDRNNVKITAVDKEAVAAPSVPQPAAPAAPVAPSPVAGADAPQRPW